jgi:hypothetical protein
MDRDELEERLRTRRPGDPAFRRGGPIAERPEAYEPFAPEPEDQLAVRPEEPVPAATPHIDDTPAGFDEAAAAATSAAWPRQERQAEPPEPEPPPVPAQPYYEEPYEPGQGGEPDEPAYDAQEEPYAYAPVPPPPREGRPRGGSTALPIVGFAALSVLAVGVGFALSGILTGGATGRASPTPLASILPSVEPTSNPTAEPTGSVGATATVEPTDGPITFPDGATAEVQPCATGDMGFDGCVVDGTTLRRGSVWIWLGFDDARADDVFEVRLLSAGQTLDVQEKDALNDVLAGDCPSVCGGYLIGAAYANLDPGEYQVVLRRNGDFADSATFTVES